ncbi:MAG: hypothetical protein JWO44_1514 [Bacteroidetes bacterium]|nr:hypothetical protein [Bacteroidota bacterium]
MVELEGFAKLIFTTVFVRLKPKLSTISHHGLKAVAIAIADI